MAAMHPILRNLGLTPEMIARHVVKVEPPLTPAETAKILNRDTRNAAVARRRAKFIAAGLTQAGTPRLRSPNGTRKPYVRKKLTS